MNRICLLLLLPLITLIACMPPAKKTTGNAAKDPRLDFSIVPGERIGLITASSCSKKQILTAYGDYAVEDSVYLYGLVKAPGVVLFPQDELRRVEIWWDSALDARRPAMISIVGKGASDGGSVWKTSQGIGIGSPMQALTAANGKAFNFNGFGWEYGGRVSDWKGGSFDYRSNFHFVLNTAQDIPPTVQGEVLLRSDDPVVLALNPVVSAMEFNLGTDSYRLAQLGGRWQSLTDKSYILQIEGASMKHFNGGKLSLQSQIRIEESCEGPACTGGKQNGQWCFLEEGQFDVQCQRVLRSGDTLEFVTDGATGKSLQFRRLQ